MANWTECVDCDYLYLDEGVYYCRRYPPQMVLINPQTTGFASVWPEVSIVGDYGCAEGQESG